MTQNQTFKKLRFGFKGKNQLPLFMLWIEYWECGEIVDGKVLINTMNWRRP